MAEARAVLRFVRVAPRKARPVVDMIRGQQVPLALAMLKHLPRHAARVIEKVLRSAVANLQQKDGFSGDIDRLYVSACYANQGPSLKRVRPAPMGRAYRVVKRSAHLTVRITERPLKIAKVGTGTEGAETAAKSGARRGSKKAAASA